MSTATPDTPPSPPTPPSHKGLLSGLLKGTVWLGLGGLVCLFAFFWWSHRATHSITEDAFVEAHIVNVAAQSVSGRLVSFYVEENDRVEKGQVLAEIDPVPYRDQVNIAKSKLETAQAELRRQESALARLRLEVPIQIAIARRGFAAAQADEGRAREAVKLTIDEVEKGIEEAQAGLEAAHADLALAEKEYERYVGLFKVEAVPKERSDQVTRSRDAARAHKKLASAKLARARADRTRIDVAKRTLEAAEKTTQKASKGVDLAETGNAQIHEVELLTLVKKESVEDARRALEAAQDNLKYTKILAPFPGVVVKRYRHLGDFASAGVSILSMYNPDLLYVTANLEETRLIGVSPGNEVTLRLDAFSEPFRGRVVWINKSTGAQFALMPRNVVAGEFTKVVQRVPVRIWIEKDERWPLLQAGLSVHVDIAHGRGDASWAEKTGREMADLERRYNQVKEPTTRKGRQP